MAESTAATSEAPHRFGLVAFVRSAGLLSLSSLATLVRAVVTAKILAVTLGPSQVGILSQLLNFSALLFTIIPLGLTSGVAKLVAEARTDRPRVDLVAGSSALMALASGLAAALLLAPFNGAVSTTLTGTPRYGGLVLLVLASFPLSNLAGVLGYVLQGFADVSRLTRASVTFSAVSVVVLVPATYLFGLKGAIAAVAVNSVFEASIYSIAVARAYRSRAWPLGGFRFSRPTARRLLGYGGVLLVAAVAMSGALLVVRTLTVRELGGFENGIYQVAYGLSNQYMTVFMTWMAAYVFPRVSQAERSRVGALLNSALRANLFLMVPVLTLVIALRQPLIHVLYTGAFLPAAPLIPVQAFGDFARVVGWSFGISLFAHDRTGGYLLAILAQSVAWVAAAVALLPFLGLPAVPAAYALSSLLWPALMYPMARRWLGVRIGREGGLLTLLGLACVLAATVLPWWLAVLVAAVVPGTVYLLHRRALAIE